jgi:hypothetical protein
MSTAAIFLFFKALFKLTTFPVTLYSIRKFYACLRIHVGCAEFLPALPTPGPTTPATHMKFSTSFQAACENIIARSIF